MASRLKQIVSHLSGYYPMEGELSTFLVFAVTQRQFRRNLAKRSPRASRQVCHIA